MIVTLTGKNVRAVNTALNQIIDEFKRAHGDSVERFDVSEMSDFDTIIDAVRSLSLLDPRKLVIVKDFGQSKQFLDKLEGIVAATADSTELVLVDPKADKRSTVVKNLKKITDYHDFAEAKPQEVARWVVQESKNFGARMSQSDAMYLVDRIGTNELMLQNELKKLAAYHDEITRQSIDLLTVATPQSKVFDMLDALFRKDLKRAWALYEDQRAQGEEGQKLLAMVIWQLHHIALAVFAPRKDSQLLVAAGLSPYTAQKALQIGRNLSPSAVRQMIDRLVEIDYLTKTSADVDAALAVYFAEVSES